MDYANIHLHPSSYPSQPIASTRRRWSNKHTWTGPAVVKYASSFQPVIKHGEECAESSIQISISQVYPVSTNEIFATWRIYMSSYS